MNSGTMAETDSFVGESTYSYPVNIIQLINKNVFRAFKYYKGRNSEKKLCQHLTMPFQ